MPAPITELRSEAGPTGPSRAELPSRAALTQRLEVQRAELLSAMECVHHAHRILQEHILKHPVASEQHRSYERRMLESLEDAKQSLAKAYPLLERIVQELHVDKILMGH